MSKEIAGNHETLEEVQRLLEIEKVNAKRDLLKAAVNFATKTDPAINDRVLVLLDLLIEHAKNPDVSNQGDVKKKVEEALEELKKQSGKSSAVGGGDIVGEDWIDDMGRFISALFELVKEEKAFFLSIIKLVICGCK